MSEVDEIKDRLDIVDVISTYVPLKKAGRSYKGLCPFHSEKTPSFVVFPESQNWHCFGACGTGGDVFSFIMKRENLDFGEALAVLAARAGVELKPREKPEADDEKRFERLRAMVAEAATYFHYLLVRSGEAQYARDHLAGRGFSETTWETWQLGYSLDSWDALRERLVGKGYRLEELDEAGLIIHNEEKDSYYDRFRGRLMIPIRDSQGRTIGFGARILKEDPARPGPKYINSPQTPLFDKGNVVFGLDMARKAIRDTDLAVLVEGYMDVIMSHQVGVANVVAGMGTALTESQLRQIKRYSSNVTLALDPDVAGEHAALRGLEAARDALDRELAPSFSPTGMLRHESRLKAQLRIAALPDGFDPDELAYRDVERWRDVIRTAVPIVDYYLALVAREEDLSSAYGQERAVERMAPIILEVSDDVQRQRYIQALARRVGIEEIVVRDVLTQLGRASSGQAGRSDREGHSDHKLAQKSEPAKQRKLVKLSLQGSEEHILGYLIVRPDLLTAIDEELIRAQTAPLQVDDFSDAQNRALMAAVFTWPSYVTDLPVADRIAELPLVLHGLAKRVVEEAQRKPSLPDHVLLKGLVDPLLKLRERRLNRQREQLEQMIRDGEPEEDRDDMHRLYELVASYAAQSGHIHNLLVARSLSGILAQRKALPSSDNHN